MFQIRHAGHRQLRVVMGFYLPSDSAQCVAADCVVFLVAANLFWLWLLKMFPFSLIYPLTSLGFIFGMLSGMFIFHETVTFTQWIGAFMVMGGCYFIAAQ